MVSEKGRPAPRKKKKGLSSKQGLLKKERAASTKNLSETEKIVLREKIVEVMALEGLFSQKDWRRAHEEGRVPPALLKYPEYSLQPIFPGWKALSMAALAKRKAGVFSSQAAQDPGVIDLKYWTLEGWTEIVAKGVKDGEISSKKDYPTFRKKKESEGIFLTENPETAFRKWPGWAKVLGHPDPFAGMEGAEEFRETERIMALIAVETGGDLLRPSSRPLSTGWSMEGEMLEERKRAQEILKDGSRSEQSPEKNAGKIQVLK